MEKVVFLVFRNTIDKPWRVYYRKKKEAVRRGEVQLEEVNDDVD